MVEIPDARVTKDNVLIGEDILPGLIAEGGVTVTPGGHKDMNKLTVTFLVGRVVVEDNL